MTDHSRKPYTPPREMEDASHGHFLTESGVNKDGNPFVRVFFDGNKIVMDSETAWTAIRMLSEATAAAEADALVYKWAARNLDERTAGLMLGAMRDEREHRDVSARHRHFYERISE